MDIVSGASAGGTRLLVGRGCRLQQIASMTASPDPWGDGMLDDLKSVNEDFIHVPKRQDRLRQH